MTGLAPESLDAGTDYVVLAQADDVSVGWVPLNGTVTARSPQQAIRAAVQAHPDSGGNYIAVPSRSWKSYRVTAKVETKLMLDEVTS